MVDEPVDWLLRGDPAIRWQTKRDLLDASTDEVEAERALVATSGWGERLLALQDPSGTWAGDLYGPKWTSTTYTLLLLRHCGLAQDNPNARRGVERLWEGARYFDGGLTAAVSIDAPEACITSMYIALARYFGCPHPHADEAEQWLLANQLDDGGWNCRNVRFGDRHSSFHTSILALEALAEIERDEPHRPEIAAALARGREFFLVHRLYRSHRTGEVVNPAFTRLSFPPRWHYDILRGLDHFATTGAPWDDRFRDARRIAHRTPTPRRHVADAEQARRQGVVRHGTVGRIQPLEHPPRTAGHPLGGAAERTSSPPPRQRPPQTPGPPRVRRCYVRVARSVPDRAQPRVDGFDEASAGAAHRWALPDRQSGAPCSKHRMP